MKNKIELIGKIKNGELVYNLGHDSKFFFDANEGQDCAITVKLGGDSVAFWQHKYYRGYLLPHVASESYDSDDMYAHFMLKKRFLLEQVDGIHEVPKKYIDRCILISDEGGYVLAYIPSTGDLTYSEMNNYIVKVEGLMLDYMTGLQAEAEAARKKAMEV